MKNNLLKMVVLSILSLSSLCKGMEQSTPDVHHIMGCIVGKVDTTIGIFAVSNNKPTLVLEATTKTAEITNFTEFIAGFLADLELQKNIIIKQACFGVPGNPSAQQDFIQPFSVTFAVSAHELRKKTKLETIKVVNDFEVVGFGIDVINAENVICVNQGVPRNNAPKAIIGAGNGVGSCLMVWDTERKHYSPSALGFCYSDFAPHNLLELELVNFIKQKIGCRNMSWGITLGLKAGIKKMYEFLGSTQNYQVAAQQFNAPQEIFDASRDDAQSKDAVDLYMKLYTRLIRNVAYIVLPYGGLYITNAVAENNPELFKSSTFFKEILNCRDDLLVAILQEIPFYVVTDPQVKIYGAAQYLLLNQ